ncbi:hypothetical protein RHS03_01149, partial [Rhizoctonia solani]
MLYQVDKPATPSAETPLSSWLREAIPGHFATKPPETQSSDSSQTPENSLELTGLKCSLSTNEITVSVSFKVLEHLGLASSGRFCRGARNQVPRRVFACRLCPTDHDHESWFGSPTRGPDSLSGALGPPSLLRSREDLPAHTDLGLVADTDE